jgi:peptide chain release factor subunit 1
VPFQNQVGAAARADLYQLAKLQDEFETSVIGVLDSNTARLFMYQFGALVDAGGPDDDPENYRRTDVGGWSQARYQRHIDTHRMHFAKEIAQALDDLVEREGATRVVLAGDEVVMEALRPHLSRGVAEKLAGTFRIRIGEDVKHIEAEVVPILRQAEREEDLSMVERLVARVRGGHLGIAGVEATRRALELGQVHILIIDEAHAPPESRAELVRLAAATDAAVEIVRGAPPMAEMEGVGALLRFQFYV